MATHSCKHRTKTALAAFAAIICIASNTAAQTINAETAIDIIIETIAEPDEDNESQAEELKEMLSELAENKININQATRQELERLPFLSPKQIENILYYVNEHGPMQMLDELLLVEEIDAHTAALLRVFTEAGSSETKTATSLAQMFKHGKSQATTKFKRTLNNKKGYDDVDDETRAELPGTYYLGSPFYNSIKYAYRYRDMMSIGVTAEKDPGEEFFKGTNAKGYDFYSAHFFARTTGMLKTIALGDYKASFGRGLVMSNDYYMGKSIYMSSLHNRKGGLRRHSSTDENNFLRGAGATIAAKNIEITTFYSFKSIDATLSDSLVSSLKTDGYHRLQRDIRARNTVSNHIIGTNINYESRYFNIGATAIGDFYSKAFTKGEEPYRAYHPEGKRFFNASLTYDFRWRNIFAGGETAVDGNGNMATINSIDIYPASGYRIFLMHRQYAKGYVAHHSRTIASNTATRNEKGITCGAEINALRSLDISLMADVYTFPWLRYTAGQPSAGSEIYAKATYAPRQSITFRAQYRRKSAESNLTDDDGNQQTAWTHTNKLRAGFIYTGLEALEAKTDIDLCIAARQGRGKSRGIALTQSAACTIPRTTIRIEAALSVFDTDDYYSRIYIPTKNLPQTFYYPAAYGKGAHFSLVARCGIGRRANIALNYSLTAYDDRETISSGAEEIQGSTRSEIGAFLTLKF